MICSCGNAHFFAAQNVCVEIVVASDGNYEKDLDSGIESAIKERSEPIGPFICTACGKEYTKL